MLIDKRHKKWSLVAAVLAVAALVLYGWFSYRTPGGLTGGSTVGLWYGVAGTALMIYAGLLSALRWVPSWWWIGARNVWLRGHIWLGLLSGVLILCHSGFHWGSGLEGILWVVLILVLATGVLGLLLQQFLPHFITTRITAEAPYEQIPHLCAVMRRKADALIESTAVDKKLDPAITTQLSQFYVAEVQPFLAGAYSRSAPLADPGRAESVFNRVRSLAGMDTVKDRLAELATYCEERRQMGEQERLYHLLHGWLLIHVPLSVVLLVLGVAHAVMSLYY